MFSNVIFVNLLAQDVISNGRINTKFLESTTAHSVTPVLSVPSVSNIPNPNAIDDNEFGYPKNKPPSVLIHYNADPIDGSLDSNYIPVTTYRPVFSTTTTLSPPTSTPVSVFSSTTPHTPIAAQSPLSVPSKYFEPPFGSDNGGDSPIIRIKSYTPLPTPIAAYTIEQINNEFQPPSSSAVAINNGAGSSVRYAAPSVDTTPNSQRTFM